MKKILLFIFLIGIVCLGAYIIRTQSIRTLKTVPTTTTTTMATDKVIIINETIDEEQENYLINVTYPSTNNEFITEDIKNLIQTRIDNFKKIISEPSPNSQKMTLSINYGIIFNQEEILSIKFEEESYTGGAHPGHIIFTKNYSIPENIEISFDSVITAESILKDISIFALDYFQKQKFEHKLFLEGLAPKIENYKTFALTNDSIIFYFNEYQIAPYSAGSFELKIPYEILESQTELEIE